MYPILFKIGPLTIHTYGVMIALGFIAAITLAIHLGRNEGIAKEKILDIGFYMLLSAIIGSRLFFVIIEYEYFIKNPSDILKIWEGGLVFYGGLFLAIIVLLIYLRKNSLPVFKTLDLLSPSLALGHAIGRLGCFSAGCCHGKPTDLPWGVVFNDPHTLAIRGIYLHPTQLYESFAEFMIFIFLMFLRKRKSFDGRVFWTYVLLYSVARFIIEIFRGDRARGFIYSDFSVAQGISAVLFLTSITFLILKSGKKA